MGEKEKGNRWGRRAETEKGKKKKESSRIVEVGRLVVARMEFCGLRGFVGRDFGGLVFILGFFPWSSVCVLAVRELREAGEEGGVVGEWAGIWLVSREEEEEEEEAGDETRLGNGLVLRPGTFQSGPCLASTRHEKMPLGTRDFD
jgi:hypothetical protein